MNRTKTTLLLCLFLTLTGCKEDETKRPPAAGDSSAEAPQATPEPPVERTQLARQARAFLGEWNEKRKEFLTTYTKQFKTSLGEMDWFQQTVTRVYEDRGHRLVFSDGIKMLPNSEALTLALEALESHGIDPAPFERETLVGQRGHVSAAQAVYDQAFAPSKELREERLWKLLQSLKSAESPTLEDIETALEEADLSDSDLPLMETTRERLDTIFESKASLNAALIQMDIHLMQRWLRYVYEMRYAVRAHPFWAHADYGRGLTRSAEKLFEHYQQTDFTKMEDELKSLVPLLPDYAAMMGGLEEYRRLAAEVEQVKLPKGVERLRKGSKGDKVILLQERLIQEGYLEGEADGAYGKELVDAVSLYQQVHQLKETGVVDRHTRSSMNKTFEHRAREIALGLQRHRESELHQGSWRFGEVPVQARVNIPAFQATFFKDGEVARTHRLVVGSNALSVDEVSGLKGHYNRTRTFSEELQTIVLNPTWKVPSRIKRQELDPMLMDEPDFYEKNNYKVEIGADGYEMVTQLSGPDNALGLVKFLFPNRFSIYMHDTPKKKLFQREIRAYSHGCMRTLDALDLARWILVDLEGVTSERFDEILATEEPFGIGLENRIPITIDYNTVGVHESGRMMFYLDVYKFNRDYFAGKIPYEVPEEPRFEQVVLVK